MDRTPSRMSTFSRVTDGSAHWRAVALLMLFPITAVLHHLVFFPGMCMLNRIGPDYTLPTIAMWLSRDPSLPLAVVLALLLLVAGERWPRVRRVTAPALIATIPLTLWVWDIPFTSRIICDSFHDGRLRFGGTVIGSRWIYLLSALLYFALLAWRRRRLH